MCLSTKDAASTDGCNSDHHADKRSEGMVSLPLCSLTNWYYRSALTLPITKPDPAFSCHSELNSELNTSLGTMIRNHDSEPPKSPKSIRHDTQIMEIRHSCTVLQIGCFKKRSRIRLHSYCIYPPQCGVMHNIQHNRMFLECTGSTSLHGHHHTCTSNGCILYCQTPLLTF